jgi:hypothetical protein
MGNYLEKKLLDYVFRGVVSWSPPGTFYIALLNDTIDDSVESGSDLPEVSGPGYERKGISRSTSEWTEPDNDGIVKNVNEVKWEEVEWEDEVIAVAFCDSSGVGSGNVLFWGDLVRSKSVAVGDTISFAPESITIQIDNDRT